MSDPRQLFFQVPLQSTTTHFRVQFSPNRQNWGTLKIATVTDFPINVLSNRIFKLDGINAAADDTNNNQIAASTAPMWYRIALGVVSGGSTWGNWLEEFVVPSGPDFMQGMKSELKDPSLEDSPGYPLLGDQDYLQCLSTAIEMYERVRPQTVAQLYTLATGVQSYFLPDMWSVGFSRIFQVEYPADLVPRSLMDSHALMLVDEEIQEIRLNRIYPTTGEKMRVFYACKHARDGRTVLQSDFNGVRLLASANAADQVFRQKNQFGDIRIGADYIGVDPRIRNWASTAAELRRQANRILGTGKTGVRTHIDSYDYHGSIPPNVLFYGP